MRCLSFTVLVLNLWFSRVSLTASCKDVGWFCWFYTSSNSCHKSSNYAVNKCKKTCNFCPDPTVNPATEEQEEEISPTTPPTTTSTPKCFGQTLVLPISQEKFIDKKLQGHVILTASVFSEPQCEDICLRVPGCLAYNYHYGGVGGLQSCELMDEVARYEDIRGYSFRLFERERVLRVLLGSCLGDT